MSKEILLGDQPLQFKVKHLKPFSVQLTGILKFGLRPVFIS
jgi:hypothetical protein